MLLNNKISSVLVCFVLLLLSVWQCKKDAQIIVQSIPFDCRQIDTNCPSSPFGTIYLGPVKNCSPFFNPNNSDEFLYVEIDTLGNSTIVIYNLLSKQKKYVIAKNHYTFSAVNWSKNNWILYGDYTDHQIYKIKTDGTNLTKLTNASGWFSYPVSTSVNEILASFSNLNSQNYMVKMDFNGNIYDSIQNGYYEMGNISNCYQLACLDNSTPLRSAITVRDTGRIKSFVYIPIDDKNRNSSLLSIAWHPNCEDIYFTNIYLDINKVNIRSYKQNIVKMGCYLDRYGVISISPDGNKIIAEKMHHYFDTLCHEYYNTDLVILNIDGTNEQKVF